MSTVCYAKILLRSLRSIIWGCLDALVIAVGKRGPAQRRVLIIRPDAIGDFVLWSNAGRELYAYYKRQGYFVVLLGNIAWAQWANDLGLGDEVWALDRNCFVRNLWYRWSWLLKLRRAGFAKVIHPVHSREFLIGDALVRATDAKECIAPIGDCSNTEYWLKSWSDKWYSRLIPETSPQVMELLRQAEFMRGLGLRDFVAASPKLASVTVSAPFNKTVSSLYVVLFVGAGSEGRVWPAEKFSEIGRRLNKHGIKVFLGGGQSDSKYAEKIFDAVNGNAINCVGKTSLSELTELLRGALVVVSNETSAVHIAAAVGTPVVGILGGGHYGRFLPYAVEKQDLSRPMPYAVFQHMSCFGCNWQCIYPKKRGEAMKCVNDISVEQVWRQIETVLSCTVDASRSSVM